ncbi:MAG TPA: hypothetical protein EYP36_09965 [Calditrichaeota bacterium]|nr:hypothetical protein [Calditrichota bacterium]
MALDYTLAQNMRSSDVPVLRFYGWQPYCVSIGFHQKKENLDINKIIQNRFEAVRRPTGGSAIFHSEELTYSYIVPKTNVNQQRIYHLIHVYIAAALQKLGYEVHLKKEMLSGNYLKKGKSSFACFNRTAQSEIQFKGRKVLGSAQKIYQNSILQHGSLLIGAKQSEITRFLKGDNAEKKELSLYLRKHSISLLDIKKRDIQPITLSEAIVEEFCKNTNTAAYYFYPTAREKEQARMYENIFLIS